MNKEVELIQKAQALRALKAMTNAQMAETLGVSERTLYRWWKKPQNNKINFTDDKKWQLTGDWCIAGDFHVGATDYGYVAEIIETCKRMNIKRLIIAGDLFTFPQINRHPKIHIEISMQEEFAEARKLLAALFAWFEQIKWFMGNHDELFLAWMEGNFTMYDLAALICPDGYANKFFVSDFDSCYIRENGRKWLVMHPNEYNPKALVVARRFADQKNCHVIHHHQHLSGEGLSTNGRYVIIDNGCVCKQEDFNYAHKRESTMPRMCQGFVVLVNGFHTRFYRENSISPDEVE